MQLKRSIVQLTFIYLTGKFYQWLQDSNIIIEYENATQQVPAVAKMFPVTWLQPDLAWHLAPLQACSTAALTAGPCLVTISIINDNQGGGASLCRAGNF